MSDLTIKEIQLEKDIEEYLTTKGGYKKGNPKKFDRKLGLDCDTFVEFIKTLNFLIKYSIAFLSPCLHNKIFLYNSLIFNLLISVY